MKEKMCKKDGELAENEHPSINWGCYPQEESEVLHGIGFDIGNQITSSECYYSRAVQVNLEGSELVCMTVLNHSDVDTCSKEIQVCLLESSEGSFVEKEFINKDVQVELSEITFTINTDDSHDSSRPDLTHVQHHGGSSTKETVSKGVQVSVAETPQFQESFNVAKTTHNQETQVQLESKIWEDIDGKIKDSDYEMATTVS